MKLSIEIKTIGEDGNPRYHNQNENIESSLGQNKLDAILSKYDSGDNKIESWTLYETLPYDEGYQAAMSGLDDDKNPYAEHFWKHEEWWLGYSAFHESN